MPQIIDYPLHTDFRAVSQLQSKGQILSGAQAPNGIPGGITIENGVMVSSIDDGDDLTATGIRSEILTPSQTYAEWWYVWEFYIPSAFAPENDRITLMQIHDQPDEGDGSKWIPFALDFEPQGYLSMYVPAHTLPSEGGVGLVTARAVCPRDEWVRACLRVKWSIDTTGFREFYLNEVPQFKHYGLATMYDDVIGPYFKCGCYDSTHNARFGSVTAYYRNVAVWSGNDGFQTVLGRLPVLPPQLLEA